ncbi:MAG: succinate dehydrogenase iron-sulfur subunit [Chloroflexi bacterium]|nr:succinate dehydrogenase iron-sulfur subunit [Chloroflexota bacterium]
MEVALKILRFNPERERRPWWGEYKVEADPGDRVLDLLHTVKWHQDGTLTLRRSCAHGICGSDAMLINGLNRLACKVLVRDLGPQIVVEPMRGFRVLKDLVVDMEPFFAKYRAVRPYLINDEPEPRKERRQSPKQRERFEDTTKCILCAACTTACPSFWAAPDFIGPAAIVQAHRFIFDSRDRGAAERLAVLNQSEGVWSCRTIVNCTIACPRDIAVTQAINEVKRAIVTSEEFIPKWRGFDMQRAIGTAFLTLSLGMLALAGFMTFQIANHILQGGNPFDQIGLLILAPSLFPPAILAGLMGLYEFIKAER